MRMKIFILLFGVVTNFNAFGLERWDFLMRYERATDDDFSIAVDRIQKIARISNAISLQQGITNGTLPIDTVISELLNFEATVIRGVNSSELAELVKEIQGFESTLKEDPGVTKVEERLIMLRRIYKATKGVEKVEKPPGYLEAAERMQTDLENVTWSPIDVLVSRFEGITFALGQLTKNVGEDISFSNVHSILKSFLVKDYSAIAPKLTGEILRKPEPFKVLLASTNSIKNLSESNNFYDISNDPKLFIKLQSHMELLGSVIDKSSAHIKSIENLKQVLVSRHHLSGNRKLSQTAGFHGGFLDLEKVFGDFTDPWIQKIVQGQSEVLKGSLSQLREVANEAHSISNSLGFASSESAMAILDIYSKVLKLSINNTFTSAASKFSSIPKEAQENPQVPNNTDNFSNLYESISELAKKLNAIDDLLTTVNLFKTQNLADSQFVINLTSTYSKENENALKSSREFQDLLKTMSALNSSIAILKENSSIADPLDTVIQNYGEVDVYISELQPILDMVKTLQQTPELEIAEDLIQVLRESRKIQIKSFDPIEKSIKEVRPKLEALEKVFKSKSSESEDLSKLPDALHDSQVIGNSARVVIGIQKALEEKKKVVLEQDWLTGELAGLDLKMDSFYKEAVQFRNYLEIPEDLLSIYDVFALAKNVSSIGLDFERLRENSNKNKTILEILDTLDTFGLDFSRHHSSIDASKDSLNSFDLFFSKFASKKSPVLTPSPLGLGPTQAPEASNSTTSNESGSSWIAGHWFYLLGGGALLGAGAGGGAWWFMRNKGSKKKKEDKSQKFGVSNAIFHMFFSDWTFQLVNFQLQYQNIPPWPDTIRLYFASFYTANSTVTTTAVSASVKEFGKCYRNQVPYSKNNRFEIKNKESIQKGRVHGNAVTLPCGKVYWLTQTPQEESTVVGKEKEANISMFWMGVVEQKGEFVMCLSKDVDGAPLPYLPLEIGTQQFDDQLSIECKHIEHRFNNKLIIRDLTIQFPKMKRRHHVKHLHFTSWPENGIPRSTDCLVNMYQTVEMSPHPVFIHCNDGVSKCGVFTQAVIHMQLLEKFNGQVAFGRSLNELRQQRQMAVSNEEEYMFVALLTFRLVVQAINYKKLGHYTRADITKFNKYIEMVLAGKATLTMANLIPVGMALPAPPSVPATTSKTLKTETPKAAKSNHKSVAEPPKRKNKPKKKKKGDAEEPAKEPLPPTRFPTVDPNVNREQYSNNARAWYAASMQNVQKVNKLKKERSKAMLKTVGKGMDSEDDLEIDIPISIDEEGGGNPAVEKPDEIPSPPHDDTVEQEQQKSKDDGENDPVPLGVLSSETNVEMPEANVPPTN